MYRKRIRRYDVTSSVSPTDTQRHKFNSSYYINGPLPPVCGPIAMSLYTSLVLYTEKKTSKDISWQNREVHPAKMNSLKSAFMLKHVKGQESDNQR
jgi:hypothetical protein